MYVTPRTCPGPGDLWQPSWQEEKRQAEYERLLEKFFEEYIPRYCDKRINELAEAGEDERHPEIAQSKEWYRKRREEELALRNDKTPILPQTPFSALFTDFFIDRNPKK